MSVQAGLCSWPRILDSIFCVRADAFTPFSRNCIYHKLPGRQAFQRRPSTA
jgi:hypothetical protein